MSGDGMHIRGYYRIKLIDPDGSIAHDTGEVQNVVTKYGIQFLLNCLAFDSFGTLDYPTGGHVDIDTSSSVAYIALGTETGFTRADWWTQGILGGEVTQVAPRTYARQQVNLLNYYTTGLIGTAHSDESNVIFKAKFPAGNFDGDILGEVGLFDIVTWNSGKLLAGSNFTQFTASASQQVDVTYTLAFSQEA